MYCKADSFTKIRARIIFVDVILILQSRKKKPRLRSARRRHAPIYKISRTEITHWIASPFEDWLNFIKTGIYMKRMLSVFPFNEHEWTRKTKVTFTCQLTLGSRDFVTVFELQCLNVNLMSNDFCRTAVLRKKYMNFCVYSLLNVWNHFKLPCFPVFCFYVCVFTRCGL